MQTSFFFLQNFTGVAPNATLGVWRIFSCEEGANENTVIKGLEQAYDAGNSHIPFINSMLS
jgi:hypothetical protein